MYVSGRAFQRRGNLDCFGIWPAGVRSLKLDNDLAALEVKAFSVFFNQLRILIRIQN